MTSEEHTTLAPAPEATLTGRHHDLIVSIVPKGGAERVMRASLEAGASGGTILYGRGVGIHEHRTLLGIPIEPEKEVLLTVAPRGLARTLLAAIVEAGELDTPGKGIVFTLPISDVAGICHADTGDGCLLLDEEPPPEEIT